MNPHDADPSPTELPSPPVDVDADAPPKRRRAPRKKVAEAGSAPEVAAGNASAVTAPSAASIFGERADSAPAPVAMEVDVHLDIAATASADGADDGGDGNTHAGETGAGAPGEGSSRPKRARKRRRGRRGGERGELAVGAPGEGVDGAAPSSALADDGDEGDDDEAKPAPIPDLPPAHVGEVFAEVLSGAYDADAQDELPPLPAKRVLAAEPDAPKLHKVLAQAGIGSRRDMEQMIVDGRITVNGEPAHIGQRISFGDRIAVGGKPVRVRIAPPPPRVLAYHKPAGEVVTHDDPQQRPTVFRRLPRLHHGKWQSVGRLDINTEGLLLFTNSGELANRLMHPRFGIEREYAVRSLGVLEAEAKARLLEGVDIDGQHCAFKSIEDGGGEGVNHWYRVVITEGRNREVRKLFEAAGHAVSRLIRIRYGTVVLPRGLRRGVWVDLGDNDVATLRHVTQVEHEGARSHERGPQGEREGERGVERDGGPRRGKRGGRRGRGGERGPDRAPNAVAERGPGQGPERADRGDRGPIEQRPPRGPRPERGPRPPRPDRPDRPDRGDRAEGREHGDPGLIPNPLQQTFDKRAIQQARATRRDIPDDGPIPNPLQQTFDKRAMQQARTPQRDVPDDGPIPNPLQQTYDKRFAPKPQGGNKGGAGGRGGRSGGRGGKAGDGSQRQPDPMQTSSGYIGADALRRKGGGGRGGRGGGGGGGGGGGPSRSGQGGRGHKP